jgi:hypothetical protein
VSIDPRQVLEICEKATPGPWKECNLNQRETYAGVYANAQYRTGGIMIAPDVIIDADAQFIALARSALPELAQRVLDLTGPVYCDAENCRFGCFYDTGDGWHEPRTTEFDCRKSDELTGMGYEEFEEDETLPMCPCFRARTGSREIEHLREVLSDIYPLIAGRVIQLKDAGETQAMDAWNDAAKKVHQALGAERSGERG